MGKSACSDIVHGRLIHNHTAPDCATKCSAEQRVWSIGTFAVALLGETNGEAAQFGHFSRCFNFTAGNEMFQTAGEE